MLGIVSWGKFRKIVIVICREVSWRTRCNCSGKWVPLQKILKLKQNFSFTSKNIKSRIFF